MPLPTRTYEQIKADILRDIAGQREDAVLTEDSDEAVRASGSAAAIEGLYSHQQWVLRQLFPQTADYEYLLFHAQQIPGMEPKMATLAGGSFAFAGDAGAPVPSGTEATLNGLRWITTASITLDESGAGIAAANAEAVGSSGNLAEGTVLTLSAAPIGVTGVSVVLMGGGTDDETVEEFRDRLLFALQNPDGAGAPSDYLKWARAVPGVTQAYCFPLRRGLGSVDIAITSAGSLPSPDLITAAQAAIDLVAPAGADARVFSPSEHNVDMTIAIAYAGITFGDARTAVQAAVTNYFAGLAPGEKLVIAKLEAVIIAISGITDVAITVPVANVLPTVTSMVLEWLRAGTITVVNL